MDADRPPGWYAPLPGPVRQDGRMDLVSFLRERLDADEQAARAADGASWRVTADQDDFDGDVLVGFTTLRDSGGEPMADDRRGPMASEDLTHIARHDPARVLAEVEAKRRIVDEHQTEGDTCRTCTTEDREVLWDGETETVEWVHRSVAAPCRTLRLLALPYASHDDYDERWRP